MKEPLAEMVEPTTVEEAIMKGFIERWEKDGSPDRSIEYQAAFVARGTIMGFKLGFLAGSVIVAIIALLAKAFL